MTARNSFGLNWLGHGYVRRYPMSKRTLSFEGRTVVIRSDEKDGVFWRPGALGYTAAKEEAWQIEFAHALRLTSDCGPEKRLAFVLA